MYNEDIMGLQEKIQGDLKTAMKARDSERTGAVRILIGEFARQQEKNLSDAQIIAIVKKLIKSERELLAAQGEKDSSFLRIMEEYLPRQADEEEIRAWITANLDLNAFAGRMQAMRPVMDHFGAAADGKVVKKVLESLP
jgi:uncharacterized protein